MMTSDRIRTTASTQYATACTASPDLFPVLCAISSPLKPKTQTKICIYTQTMVITQYYLYHIVLPSSYKSSQEV